MTFDERLCNATKPDDTSKDVYACNQTYGSLSTRFPTQSAPSVSVKVPFDSTHFVIHNIQRTNLSALAIDIEWSSLNRSQKSVLFRERRRRQNQTRFGDANIRRLAVKNSNRQTAALNRQRDENGKFLWGPRKTRID